MVKNLAAKSRIRMERPGWTPRGVVIGRNGEKDLFGRLDRSDQMQYILCGEFSPHK